jgi:hypothetical protein
MMQNSWNAEDQPQVWQRLPQLDVTGEIEGALAAANLVLPPVPIVEASSKKFDSNDSFWRAILHQEARSNATVTLQNFLLFEWFPRSPGQFHTEDARNWRESAKDHLFPLSDRQRQIYENTAPVDPVVYNLYGKYCMLRGGIGCIRLKPKPTEAGLLWFMSASSTLSAHEGVPVAISESDYNQYIEYINEHGVLPCTLVGKLKFLPEPLLSLYQDYTGVPHLYLLVEAIFPSHAPLQLQERGPVVSVAVTFSSRKGNSEQDSSRNFSAAYISFAGGDKDSLERRLPWLDYYVSNLNEGTIVTDFDEHMTRFNGAVFSLDKVCKGRLDHSEVINITNHLSIRNADVLITNQRKLRAQINANQVKVERITVVGDVFKNIGAGATIINRSSLVNAMNVANNTVDPSVGEALRQLAEFIQQSGNKEAAENFNEFTKELQQPSPRKSLLRSFWNGMLAALPTIADLATVAAAVAALVA